MRRFVFGLLWFMVFSYGLSIGGAFIAEQLSNGETSQVARQQAREAFGKRFGPFIFFGSIILAVAGTVTGRLPGTKPSQGGSDEKQGAS